jgi:hypothetical protein
MIRTLPACAAAAWLATACASPQSPLMRPVMLLNVTPVADSALVVFLRESNPCDGGDPFRIVDDAGRFLGEAIPNSKFEVRMPPGHHAFFAWQPNGDLPRDLYPDANQVGALEADLGAGRTYTVEVSIANDTHGVRKTCFGYQFLALHFVDATTPSVAEALDNAAPFLPDVVKGQAAVEQDRTSVSAHIALGMRKLDR